MARASFTARIGFAVALLLVPAGCRSAGPSAPAAAPQPALDPDRLTLVDFDVLPWDELAPTPIPLPEAVAAEVEADGRLRFRDRDRFREEVLAESRRLGVDPDAIGSLSPRAAVIHAIDVVTSRLEFALVDSGEFKEKYPARLFPEIDVYFHEREGDCDKYRDLVKAVYALFRDLSPAGLANVFVVSQGFGGNDAPHAWNAVLLSLGDGRIAVAHVDPTFYDGGGELGATAEHVSRSTFRLSFLFRVGEYAAAREEIARVLPKVDPWTRQALYAKKAAIEMRLAERGEGGFSDVLATYDRALVEGFDHVYSRHFDRILSCAVRAYAALGRDSAARRAYERLAREYPQSVFRATLVSDPALGRVLRPAEAKG